MRALLKKIIPKTFVAKVKKGLSDFDNYIVPLFAKTRWSSSIYYTLFSKQFSREHHAVLQGRLNYAAGLMSNSASTILLRRNTHRLEKGLIMKPRRATFASGYIEETVKHFVHCVNTNSIDEHEYQWTFDVLSKYFSVVEDDEVISKARKIFIENFEPNTKPNSVPYEKQNAIQSNIEYQDFATLCQQRRSVRWYENKPVEMEKITKAISCATQAPSACNRQPFQFYVFNSPEKAQKIGKIPMGTVGFHQNFQCIIVVIGDLSAYPNERDRHIIYIDASLASMQFMLALETLGLSSCVINWPDVEYCEKRMAKELNLKPHQRPIMLISVGYAEPTGQIPYSQKRTPEQLIKEC